MTHDYQLIRYELQKKTTKVQKKNFWHQGSLG